MTAAHDSAILARLAATELAGAVYHDKPIPTSARKYLRVRTGTGLITATRLTGPLTERRKTYWLTGVGITPAQAGWVLEQATEQLLNWAPTVPGWACMRLELAASQPVDVDPDRDDRFFGVDQWDLTTEPAP